MAAEEVEEEVDLEDEEVNSEDNEEEVHEWYC
jgi:hypothetical protein